MLDQLFSALLLQLQSLPSWLSSVLLLLMILFYLGTYPQIRVLLNPVLKLMGISNLSQTTTEGADMEFGNPNSANVWVSDDGQRVHCVRIPIGVWNMAATATVAVAHALGANFINVVSATCVIINDALDAAYFCSLGGYFNGTLNSDVAIQKIANANLMITRAAGGTFNGVAFDDAVMNRGYIVLIYTTN